MIHREDIVAAPQIGARVAELRKACGLTQLALAEALGELGWNNPSHLVVYKVECGLRKVDTHELAMFSVALDCAVQDFFDPPPRRIRSPKRTRKGK